MKVTLLRSAVDDGDSIPCQYATSFVINGSIAVDAGCLGFVGHPDDQAKIKHVLITHSHIDHIATLPIFVENAFEGKRECVQIYGSDAVLTALTQDIFNNRVWPDFVALSPPGSPAPFMKLHQIVPGQAFQIEGITITPVEVNHVVPTTGFILNDGKSSFIIVSDTGPTEEIWRVAQKTPNLKGVFLEVTFPNAMERLAVISKHLTPNMMADELKKVSPSVPVYAVHLKARFRDAVASELAALKLPNLHLAKFQSPYEF